MRFGGVSGAAVVVAIAACVAPESARGGLSLSQTLHKQLNAADEVAGGVETQGEICDQLLASTVAATAALAPGVLKAPVEIALDITTYDIPSDTQKGHVKDILAPESCLDIGASLNLPRMVVAFSGFHVCYAVTIGDLAYTACELLSGDRVYVGRASTFGGAEVSISGFFDTVDGYYVWKDETAVDCDHLLEETNNFNSDLMRSYHPAPDSVTLKLTVTAGDEVLGDKIGLKVMSDSCVEFSSLIDTTQALVSLDGYSICIHIEDDGVVAASCLTLTSERTPVNLNVTSGNSWLTVTGAVLPDGGFYEEVPDEVTCASLEQRAKQLNAELTDPSALPMPTEAMVTFRAHDVFNATLIGKKREFLRPGVTCTDMSENLGISKALTVFDGFVVCYVFNFGNGAPDLSTCFVLTEEKTYLGKATTYGGAAVEMTGVVKAIGGYYEPVEELEDDEDDEDGAEYDDESGATSAPSTLPPSQEPTSAPPTAEPESPTFAPAPTTKPPTLAPTTKPPTNAPTTEPPSTLPTTKPPTLPPSNTQDRTELDPSSDLSGSRKQEPGSSGTAAGAAPHTILLACVAAAQLLFR
mmetsp:Transcript_7187/g.20242  ORF Transcript_7187/g.20242 Transcript_7187/m.20242 type:complete len:582 (+) Transcript_7187:123-1868(+)